MAECCSGDERPCLDGFEFKRQMQRLHQECCRMRAPEIESRVAVVMKGRVSTRGKGTRGIAERAGSYGGYAAISRGSVQFLYKVTNFGA